MPWAASKNAQSFKCSDCGIIFKCRLLPSNCVSHKCLKTNSQQITRVLGKLYTTKCNGSHSSDIPCIENANISSGSQMNNINDINNDNDNINKDNDNNDRKSA